MSTLGLARGPQVVDGPPPCFTSFLSSASLYVAPGDPLDFLLQGRSPTPEMVAGGLGAYGLDDPFLVQYWHWLVGVLHLDFGCSLQFREDVGHLIGARVPTTLGLIVMSGTIICVFGLAVGIVGRPHGRPRLRRALLVLSTILAAIPSFVAAIILISVFSVRLGWFPTSGAGRVWRPDLPPRSCRGRVVPDVHRPGVASDPVRRCWTSCGASTWRSR